MTDEPTIVVELLADALDAEPDEPDWIWRGYIAPGWTTLLYGWIKSGKTTLLCQLLDFLRRAPGEMLGLPLRSTSVLILTEQPASVFKQTLANFGLEFDRERIEVMFYRKQPGALTWPEMVRQATIRCHLAHHGLLVIDTYARWASLEKDHDATEILATMVPIGLAAESGLAILVVHHSRKAGGSHGMEISGRAELGGQFDVLMSLQRTGEAQNDPRQILGDGRSVETPEKIVYGIDENGLVALVDDNRAVVLDACVRLGEFTFKDAEQATGMPESTVRREVLRLLAVGRVREIEKAGKARRFSSSSP